MDTRLTIKQIELSIKWCALIFNPRTDIMVPNLSFGLLNHEADIAIINKSGYLTDIEIKRSLDDLKADFKKKVFHKDDKVRNFCYCLPLSIKDKATEVFDTHQEEIKTVYGTEEYKMPTVLWYNENGVIKVEWGLFNVNKSRKLFLEEREKIAKLMSMRYWNLLEENTQMPENNERI